MRIKPLNGYKNVLVHQYIWMVANKCDIPKDENDNSFIVHHIDENKLNNSISNLILITTDEHNKIHHIGNEHCVGRKLSVETKTKISKGNKGKIISNDTKIKMKKSQLKRWKTKKGIEN